MDAQDPLDAAERMEIVGDHCDRVYMSGKMIGSLAIGTPNSIRSAENPNLFSKHVDSVHSNCISKSVHPSALLTESNGSFFPSEMACEFSHSAICHTRLSPPRPPTCRQCDKEFLTFNAARVHEKRGCTGNGRRNVFSEGDSSSSDSDSDFANLQDQAVEQRSKEVSLETNFSARDDANWNCSFCSYQNPTTALSCIMCGKKRPRKASVAAELRLHKYQ